MRKTEYNRFPTSGLLWEYKPFILKETRKYADQYWLPFDDVLDEAVYLAAIAAKKFNPHRGCDFSTLLRHYLKGLHRFCKKRFRQGTFGMVGNRAVGSRYGCNPKIDQPEPTDRYRAWLEYGDDQGRISWDEHRPALLDLERYQRQSLRLIEKAVLDWMIEPGTRSLKEVAEWIGVSKGYASKVRLVAA